MTSAKVTSGCYNSKAYILMAVTAMISVATIGFPVVNKISMVTALRYWGLLCILWIISYQDADNRIIPNRCIIAILLLAVLFQSPEKLCSHLLSVIMTGGLLLLAAGLQRSNRAIRFLGGGDVKLLLVLGLFLRPGQVLYMLLLAGAFGLITAMTAFFGREKLFPFGPGICAAAAISLLLI